MILHVPEQILGAGPEAARRIAVIGATTFEEGQQVPPALFASIACVVGAGRTIRRRIRDHPALNHWRCSWGPWHNAIAGPKRAGGQRLGGQCGITSAVQGTGRERRQGRRRQRRCLRAHNARHRPKVGAWIQIQRRGIVDDRTARERKWFRNLLSAREYFGGRTHKRTVGDRLHLSVSRCWDIARLRGLRIERRWLSQRDDRIAEGDDRARGRRGRFRRELSRAEPQEAQASCQ